MKVSKRIFKIKEIQLPQKILNFEWHTSFKILTFFDTDTLCTVLSQSECYCQIMLWFFTLYSNWFSVWICVVFKCVFDFMLCLSVCLTFRCVRFCISNVCIIFFWHLFIWYTMTSSHFFNYQPHSDVRTTILQTYGQWRVIYSPVNTAVHVV